MSDTEFSKFFRDATEQEKADVYMDVIQKSREKQIEMLTHPSSGEVKTLGEALPKEQARVREVLGHYKEIGPAGMFGAAMIEQILQKADQAVVSGDVVAMIAAYKDLQEING